MIAGVSEPVKEDIQSKEENDKQYQDSQKQRALERQIRYAKRNVEMLGDLATDADRDKIKQAQAQMRAFIQSTGRTRRYDREQIVTQRGTTGIKPTVKTPIAPVVPTTITGTLQKIVTTKQEAYDSLRETFTDVDEEVLKLDEELLTSNVNRFNELNARFGAVETNNGSLFSVNHRQGAIAYVSGGYKFKEVELSLSRQYYNRNQKALEEYEKGQKTGFKMPSSDEYKATYTITHEYGHILEAYVSRKRTNFDIIEQESDILKRKEIYKNKEKELADGILNEIIEIAQNNNANFDLEKNLSKYAHTNSYEAFAEIFANSQCGKPNELGLAMQEWLTNEGY
jgi:hypothetical protein